MFFADQVEKRWNRKQMHYNEFFVEPRKSNSLFWVCPTFLQKPLTEQLYNIFMGLFFHCSQWNQSNQDSDSFWLCHWNFSVHMWTYCWVTCSSVLWSFTSHAAPNHNWAGEFTCFLQEVIWICFGFSGCKFHFIPSAALGHFLFSGHIPEIFLTSIMSTCNLPI